MDAVTERNTQFKALKCLQLVLQNLFSNAVMLFQKVLVGFAMAKRGGGMGMGGRGGMGGGMQFGKIGLKLDRMNLHALAERQNEEDVEEVQTEFHVLTINFPSPGEG